MCILMPFFLKDPNFYYYFNIINSKCYYIIILTLNYINIINPNNIRIIIFSIAPFFISYLNYLIYFKPNYAGLSCSVMSDCLQPQRSLLGFSAHGHSPGRNTGVGCHAFLQGIFPTRGSISCFSGRFFTI